MSQSEQAYRFAKNVYLKFGKIDCWINNVGAVR